MEVFDVIFSYTVIASRKERQAERALPEIIGGI